MADSSLLILVSLFSICLASPAVSEPFSKPSPMRFCWSTWRLSTPTRFFTGGVVVVVVVVCANAATLNAAAAINDRYLEDFIFSVSFNDAVHPAIHTVLKHSGHVVVLRFEVTKVQFI